MDRPQRVRLQARFRTIDAQCQVCYECRAPLVSDGVSYRSREVFGFQICPDCRERKHAEDCDDFMVCPLPTPYEYESWYRALTTKFRIRASTVQQAEECVEVQGGYDSCPHAAYIAFEEAPTPAECNEWIQFLNRATRITHVAIHFAWSLDDPDNNEVDPSGSAANQRALALLTQGLQHNTSVQHLHLVILSCNPDDGPLIDLNQVEFNETDFGVYDVTPVQQLLHHSASKDPKTCSLKSLVIEIDDDNIFACEQRHRTLVFRKRHAMEKRLLRDILSSLAQNNNPNHTLEFFRWSRVSSYHVYTKDDLVGVQGGNEDGNNDNDNDNNDLDGVDVEILGSIGKAMKNNPELVRLQIDPDDLYGYNDTCNLWTQMKVNHWVSRWTKGVIHRSNDEPELEGEELRQAQFDVVQEIVNCEKLQNDVYVLSALYHVIRSFPEPFQE